MSDVVIRAEGISKEYYYGGSGPYRALRDTISLGMRRIMMPWSKPKQKSVNGGGRNGEKFLALDDVSFEIKKGDIVGLIGRNGSGKSTLLKILSRITEPTYGRAVMRGRTGSLLEVGTGFHPELTGRENIFLNGAIIGMSRNEIKERFDDIVDFAEIDNFIDTPVKHYSSGMFTRLAFSVAAHLEPDILLVDEVLAVGDTRFQKKCINMMDSLGNEGRTIFLVSHNMQLITRLCNIGILLNDGKIQAVGPASEVVHQYLSSGTYSPASRSWNDVSKAPGDNIARIREVSVRDKSGNIMPIAQINEPVTVEMIFDVMEGEKIITPSFHFISDNGVCAFSTNAMRKAIQLDNGTYCSHVTIPENFFAEGLHTIHAILTNPHGLPHAVERDVLSFQVVDPADGTTVRGDYLGEMSGAVRPDFEWTIKNKDGSYSQ